MVPSSQSEVIDRNRSREFVLQTTNPPINSTCQCSCLAFPHCAFSNAKSHVFFRHTWNYLELKQFCKKRVIYVDGFHIDDTGVVDAHPGRLSLVYWHREIYQRPTIWIGFKEVILSFFEILVDFSCEEGTTWGWLTRLNQLKNWKDFPFDTFRRGQNTLKLKFTNASDAGNFDCQVSTNPKISQIFKLNIIGIKCNFNWLYMSILSIIWWILQCHLCRWRGRRRSTWWLAPQSSSSAWILSGYYWILYQDII